MNEVFLDSDGDGLSDISEVTFYETNRYDADTDGDGLSDSDEFFVYPTNPNDPDADNDTLTDYEEIIIYGTNPQFFDTDSDSLPDAWEVEYGFNPCFSIGVDGRDGDLDEDYLSNYQEFKQGTHPVFDDTDGDGLSDGIEVGYYTHATNQIPFDCSTEPSYILASSNHYYDNESFNIQLPFPVKIADITVNYATISIKGGILLFENLSFPTDFGNPYHNFNDYSLSQNQISIAAY